MAPDSATVPADDLTAALEQIRERAAWKDDPARTAAAARDSAEDVPLLLAAIEAALAHHVEAVIEDIKPEPFHYCKTCSGHPKWPCPEVRDITAALNGGNDSG